MAKKKPAKKIDETPAAPQNNPWDEEQSPDESICRCPCHTPGSAMMHIVPCCGPGSANPNLKPPGTSIALPGIPIEPEADEKGTTNTQLHDGGNGTLSQLRADENGTTTQLQDEEQGNGLGNELKSCPSSGLPEDFSAKIQTTRAKLPGESRATLWERLRKAARNAGLPRGQGPGTAYEWANQEVERILGIAQLVPETTVEPTPTAGTESLESQENEQIDPEICEPLVHKTPEMEVAPKEQPADLGVAGLGEIPESWPELPANAQLQIEIAWVTANRLKVRSGKGVDLSRALSPAPSYSALSWLETSILFPAKFADISVKATAQTDDEKEDIRREKLAIEEIRSILKEMLEAKKD